MTLAMKTSCEKCLVGLAHDSDAFICSYECTFCPECAASVGGTCPNCRGELVARPTRSELPRASASSVRHGALVEWARGETLAREPYSRVHTWRFDGGASVRASASPHIVKEPWSDPTAVDPEEGFVAAISSCHMLWFLALAARGGLVVDEYVDAPYAAMVPRPGGGRTALAHVVLRPTVTFAASTPCEQAELERLHREAHQACFLANALRYPVFMEVAASADLKEDAGAR